MELGFNPRFLRDARRIFPFHVGVDRSRVSETYSEVTTKRAMQKPLRINRLRKRHIKTDSHKPAVSLPISSVISSSIFLFLSYSGPRLARKPVFSAIAEGILLLSTFCLIRFIV